MTITRTISTLAVDTTLVDAGDVTTIDNQLLTLINNLENGIDGSEKLRMIEIATPGSPAASSVYFYAKSDDKLYKKTSAGVESAIEAGTIYPTIPQGRLTLTSGLPVTTSDVTAATTIYYTPYGGNQVRLYTGGVWTTYALTELSYSLAGLAASLPRDIFLHYSGSALELLPVGWSSISARATALVSQDGALVLTSDHSYLYVGTICTTSTVGQTEDSVLNRLVWNYYNRVQRDFYLIEATDSWTYATATIRPWNNSTANRFSFVRGVSEDAVFVQFYAFNSISGAVQAGVGIGLDSTTVFSSLSFASNQTAPNVIPTAYCGKPSAGFHFLQLLERASGATVTFYGDNGALLVQSGAYGSMPA